ncbi:MAG: deoxyguanosinetriphosphate triphosphohydrolase [Tepidiphilus sp.]|nr:deoxyguanosinetriphosphate triphosphohydrolase [Tepidiphilus sp.]MDD3433925.1 deoxyguanosinetriphosphate triphosphohydrolase [Tepidiphilus sp.]
MLAPYAVHEASSRGRRHPEPSAAPRSEFQRDRDRIVHSSAFRRLEYKTQVFVNHVGDHFRTRLTHSLEVAQIGRSIAQMLGVNDVLVEAITLAHDLGHTPFGHAGQEALDECMKDEGGFEHNLQSLRIVDELEEKYAEFDGLNLMFETREGILKHCRPEHWARLGEVAERFRRDLRPSLEAQIANLADELAYNNHDIDDGLRSGLITLEALEAVPIFARTRAEVEARHPGLERKRLIHETIRRMISLMVLDLVEESRRRIAEVDPACVEDVRRAPPLVRHSSTMREEVALLKRFLFLQLYRHPRVIDMNRRAQRIIRELFAAYAADPALLPEAYRRRFAEKGRRALADYIAGMTDRYAVREHRRLFGLEEAF